MDHFENIIKDLYWKKLEEEEGITKDDADLVMLDIAFSPVIPHKGDDPCEVLETNGDKYIVLSAIPQTVSADVLKVMRYRYLSQRKNPFAHLFK